ncbi:AMP-binding protein [Brevibacillus sp. SYSU BS000544]|uniref:AMP-binding protein n=1 Tax=Brevibacillus sp. SYSU BS000544 TaxID=3416443 RepID=UPI003CE54F87
MPEIQPLHELLRFHARTTPDKIAVIYYGRTISYQELDELSDRFAHFLLQRGLGKGDRVALFMQNCPQYLICHYGIQKIGAIVSPCNPMFKEWELEYQLLDLSAKMIVTLDQYYPVVKNIQEKTSLHTVVLTNYTDFLPSEPSPTFPERIESKTAIDGTYDLMDILEADFAKIPDVEIDMENDISVILYTSGSTGLPKGAMLTYRNAQFKTECVVKTYNNTSDDVFLGVMPLFHIAGMTIGMNVPVYVGGTIVLLTRFVPEAVLEVIERYQVTLAYTIVPMNIALLSHPKAKGTDFRSLRLNPSTSFGVILTEEISRAWENLTGVPLFDPAYGLTETHTLDAIMPPDKIKYGTVGKPTFETEIKIVSLDNSEQVLPTGEQGEILIKNPGVFKGYLNRPEETAKTLRDGWVHTGDIGKFDEEGYLYLLGRVKELIKCSGYSVFPEEVEQILLRHPAIVSAAVIGVPDPVRGESVKAFVLIKPEHQGTITAEEIISWSKEKMANYKYPRFVEIRHSLPMTGAGKLLRRVLVDEEKQKN